MKPTVYIETTIISYLAARPSRDLIRAAQQRRTLDWWRGRDDYELVTSALTIEEASAGDAGAAKRRLRHLDTLIHCRWSRSPLMQFLSPNCL